MREQYLYTTIARIGTMNKIGIIFALMILLISTVIYAEANTDTLITATCPKDAKVCDDGTIVVD